MTVPVPRCRHHPRTDVSDRLGDLDATDVGLQSFRRNLGEASEGPIDA